MRHHDARGTAVENPQNGFGVSSRNPDDDRASGRAPGNHGRIDRFAAEGGMFTVDHHEIQTALAEDFDNDRMGRLDENAKHFLPGGQPGLELRIHGHFGNS